MDIFHGKILSPHMGDEMLHYQHKETAKEEEEEKKRCDSIEFAYDSWINWNWKWE